MKRRRSADTITTNRSSSNGAEFSLTFFQLLLVSIIAFFFSNVQPTWGKSNALPSNVRRMVTAIPLSSSSSSVEELEVASSISRLRKRKLRLFSEDDSSNANHHESFSNSEGGIDFSDDWGGDDSTLVLKFSLQHEGYPTVASILDWSFVEDMKLALQDFLCQQSPLNIVHLEDQYGEESDMKELREEENQEDVNHTVTSLCRNKEFDPTSGQLLHPTALLTDQYNETSDVRWIGYEMRYPIWKVGDSYLVEADATNSSGSGTMNDVARDALEKSIIDGTLETSLETWNITSSTISLHGKEYEFFGDGLLGTTSSSGLEPIEHDANAVRAIGFVLLVIDMIFAFGFTVLAKRQRIAREERARNEQRQGDEQPTTSCLHTGLDEMLFASRQGIIAASAAKSRLSHSSSSPPTKQQRLNRSRSNEGTTPSNQRNDSSEARDYRHLLVDDVNTIRSPSTAGFIMDPNRQLSTIFSEELVISGPTSARRSGEDDTKEDHRLQQQQRRNSGRRLSSETLPAVTAVSLAAASFPNKFLPPKKFRKSKK